MFLADSLIGAGQVWWLWTVILAGVALSIVLEQRYAFAAKLSGPVIGLLLAMTLSTTGVMPAQSAVYDVVSDYLVPLAIPLLLLKASLPRIVRTTGFMFLAFHLSVAGTVLGEVVATAVLGPRLAHAAEIGGIMTASYSGGGVNFAAVKTTYASVVTDDETNPLLVADNFVMAAMFMVLLLLSGSRFLLRRFPHPSTAQAGSQEARTAAAAHWGPKPIGLRDLAVVLAIAAVIAAAGHHVAGRFATGRGDLADTLLGNRFVWITAIALLTATLFHPQLDRTSGAQELGGLALYIYLFTIGLPADLLVVLGSVPEMFLYCAIMAVVNLAVTLVLGRLCRLDLEDLLLSVNAALGGPPSAVAMAIAKHWPALVLPAMLVGIWGYVLGTPLGIATTRLLHALFG